MNKFAISCCRWITLVCIFYLLTGCQQRGPVTFLVVSDTHFGINDSVAHYNQALINQMNALPGTSYPESVGGEVEVPRGLLISGDLTDQGSSESWASFTLLYGLSGNKELNYPVFEGFGNHDGPVGGAVRAGIQDRNRQRHGLTDISENGLHYSWDWEDIHFVNLNLYPQCRMGFDLRLVPLL